MWFDNEHNSPGSLSAKLATDAVSSNSFFIIKLFFKWLKILYKINLKV